MTQRAAPPSRDRGDGLVALAVWLGAVLVYHLLARPALPSGDAHVALVAASHGSLDGHAHALYVPLLTGLGRALSLVGVSWFETARWMSVVGVATGLSFQYLGARWFGAPRAVVAKHAQKLKPLVIGSQTCPQPASGVFGHDGDHGVDELGVGQ